MTSPASLSSRLAAPPSAAAEVPRALPGFAALYDLILALGERRDDAVAAGRDRSAGERRAGRSRSAPAPGSTSRTTRPPSPRAPLTEPDPADGPAAGGGARRREAAVIGRPGAEALPFADDSFDTAIGTLVLCTVPDAAAAVAELRRVLAPGGSLLFIEHVRAADARAARRQRRLARPWATLAGGCRCTRDTLALLEREFTVAEGSRITAGAACPGSSSRSSPAGPRCRDERPTSATPATAASPSPTR